MKKTRISENQTRVFLLLLFIMIYFFGQLVTSPIAVFFSMITFNIYMGSQIYESDMVFLVDNDIFFDFRCIRPIPIVCCILYNLFFFTATTLIGKAQGCSSSIGSVIFTLVSALIAIIIGHIKGFSSSISKHYEGNNTREETCFANSLAEERSSIPDGARDSFEHIREFQIIDQIYNKFRVDLSGSCTIHSACISRSGGYRYVPNPFLGAYPYDENGNARDTSSKEIKEPIHENYFFHDYGYTDLKSMDQIDGFAYALAERFCEYCLPENEKRSLRLEDIIERFDFKYMNMYFSKGSHDVNGYSVTMQMKRDFIDAYLNRTSTPLLQWD